MSDKGISFVGDGGDDISGSMKDIPSCSLSEGGPISGGPDSNKGMSTDNFSVNNEEGKVPGGSGIHFVGSAE